MMFVPHRKHRPPPPVTGIAFSYVDDVRTSQEAQTSTASYGDNFTVYTCAVQTVGDMVSDVLKFMLLVELYLKAESFEAIQSDYSHRFGFSGPAKSVKKFRQAGNVNITETASTIIAETSTAEDSKGSKGI
jgi:hypothetical protein